MNQWYREQFDGAMEKSKSWDLKVPDIPMNADTLLDLKELHEMFHFQASQEQWSFPYDMAGNCIDRHFQVWGWFKLALKLETFLTIGDVLINGKPRYNATYEELRFELDNPADSTRIFNAHVWLTFPNYGILDVVLPAALCGEKISSETPQISGPEEMILFAGPEIRRKRKSPVTIPTGAKDGAFLYRDVYGKQKQLTYQPMLVGQDFLIRSDKALQEHWRKHS